MTGPRLWIVTGAARGIGLAVAQRAAAAGETVVLADVDAEAVAEAAEGLQESGARVRGWTVDVADGTHVRSFVDAVVSEFGRIDVVVNNAGRNTYFDAVEMTEAEWDEAMGVDLKSAWLLARSSIPQLILTRGCIVNISSIHGRLTTAGMFPYAAAKSGLEGLTRSLAVDYAARGVRVNAVAPGWTRTRLVEEWIERQGDPSLRARIEHAHPLGRLVEPDDVAAAVEFLAGASAGATTGIVLPVDAGLGITFRVD